MKLSKVIWNGRVDGNDTDVLRMHQIMEYPDIAQFQEVQSDWIIAGYPSDVGVKKNLGRTGARFAPESIRKASGSIPIHVPSLKLADAGDLILKGLSVSECQQMLKGLVETIHANDKKSIILGGGHDIMFPHASGIAEVYGEKKLGVISFDAHFDNRPLIPEIGPTSGTGFNQLAVNNPEIDVLIIGIQRIGNTRRLFRLADEYGHAYHLAEDLCPANIAVMERSIYDLIARNDIVYVTVCMDVFASAYAPGVSAPTVCGLVPDIGFWHLWRVIKESGKVLALDIAEVNPELDVDDRTSRLAARLIFEWFN